MRWVFSIIITSACVIPDDDVGALEPAGGELALYRVDHGESLGLIAYRLRFPGGYHALREALGKRTDELRGGEGLAIPIAYTRDLGLDPYLDLDLGLVPYEPPLAVESLVPCRLHGDRGTCVELDNRVACIEETPPRAESGDPETEAEYDCVWQHDGAADCPRTPGRELVVYRDGVRRVISALPSRGGNGPHSYLERVLEAQLVDLDGDRADELLAIVPLGVYTHDGEDPRRLFVIDGRSDRVTELDVEQWGAGSVVANDAACDVLVTSWEYGELDPRLPSGTYFVGRPYGYEQGALLPRGERRVRRLREPFHIDTERGELRDATPAAWLTDPAASRWRDTVYGEFRRGTIVALSARPGAGMSLDVAFPDGSIVHLDPEVKGRDRLQRVGWIEAGSPLAEAYIPADLAAWIGRDVFVDRPRELAEGEWDFGREAWIAR